MDQSRRRWLINIVLLLAVVGFVGFSLFPLIGEAFKDSQPSTFTSPKTEKTEVAGQKLKLEQEARGYSLVLQREPDNQTALQGLVQARIQLGDLPGAIAPLEKLAVANPKQIEVRLILGQLYAAGQRYDEAIANYEQAMIASPQDFRPVFALAMILKQQGQIERAKPLFENAAALAPDQYKDEINKLSSSTFQPSKDTEDEK